MSKSILFEKLNEIMLKADQFMNEAPWENKDFYGAWSAQTHYYVNHSTRLLALAGALLPIDQQQLHNRFLKHAGEEKGHENLSLLDLKNIGSSLASHPESGSTQSFYQTQYYWIEHCHPLAFFGYILFLESLAARSGQKLCERVENYYGKKCAHFLRVHADEDIAHVPEAVSAVEKFPIEIQHLILKNLEQSAVNYQNLIRQCSEITKTQKLAA